MSVKCGPLNATGAALGERDGSNVPYVIQRIPPIKKHRPWQKQTHKMVLERQCPALRTPVIVLSL